MITAHPTSLNLNVQGCCEYTKNENIKYNKTKQKNAQESWVGGERCTIFTNGKNIRKMLILPKFICYIEFNKILAEFIRT